MSRRISEQGRTAENVIKAAPQKADKVIAAELGVSLGTVIRARKRLEQSGVIDRQGARIGKDGKVRSVPTRWNKLQEREKRLPELKPLQSEPTNKPDDEELSDLADYRRSKADLLTERDEDWLDGLSDIEEY